MGSLEAPRWATLVSSSRTEQDVVGAERPPWENCSLRGLQTRVWGRSEVIVLSSVPEDLDGAGGEEYPVDIWLLLAAYIRPEDIVNFSLICKNAWTVTCTAAFWTRLYRRCDHRELAVLSG